MKAVKWQRWISIAVGVLALAIAVQPVLAQPAALPHGLPELPAIGEEMQRDSRSGLALGGYDPVAYQAEGRAVSGRHGRWSRPTDAPRSPTPPDPKGRASAPPP